MRGKAGQGTSGQGRSARTTIDWIRAAASCLRTGVDPGYWVLAALAIAGATLVRLSVPGIGSRGLAALLGIAVLVVPCGLAFVLYRAAGRTERVWGGGAALLRFFLLYLAVYLFASVVLAAVAAAARGPMVLADVWLWAFVATCAIDLLLLPLAPWTAALAIGDRTLGPGGGWLGVQGQFGGFAGAWLGAVAPLFAVHLALTLLLDDPASTLRGPALLALLAFDTLASLGQLAMTVGLGIAAWTVARERAAKLETAASDSRR